MTSTLQAHGMRIMGKKIACSWEGSKGVSVHRGEPTFSLCQEYLEKRVKVKGIFLMMDHKFQSSHWKGCVLEEKSGELEMLCKCWIFLCSSIKWENWHEQISPEVYLRQIMVATQRKFCLILGWGWQQRPLPEAKKVQWTFPENY